jgi:hypothetical protein
MSFFNVPCRELQAVLSSGVIDLPLIWQPLAQLADG